MSLRAQARTDFNENLTADGDDVTFTIGAGDPFTVKGKIARIEAGIDPDTMVQFYEPKTAVTVSLIDLPSDPDDTWLIQTTDVEGNSIDSFAIERRFDRTIGFVTFIMEAYE